MFWAVAFGLLGAAIVAQHLIALSTSPPGMYVDEASIGYNAWSIAQRGVDEHGNSWPFYFAAFGEYKNPIYVYSLAPLLNVLPLTAVTERLPAAVFGLIAILFLTLTSWRLTSSRWIALAMCALAALTPWLVQESRVGFEVISMVATLSVALWAISSEDRLTHRRFAIAGVFLMISIFAYSTGRVMVALFTVAFIAVYARRRYRGFWITPAFVLAGYLDLFSYALQHPGALTAEFNLRSIASDGAGVPVLIGRFLANYVSYFDGGYLFVSGDNNPRHNSGFAGMLLAITLPLLVLGLIGLWRRRHEALPRFLLLCLVLGPAAAAVVNNYNLPHALRSADMLPFWLLLAAYGLDTVRALVRTRLAAVAAATAFGVALVGQASLYLLDLYTAYPVRAAAAFDVGLPAAIAVAYHTADGKPVLISTTFEGDAVYIFADVALLPNPPAIPNGPRDTLMSDLGIHIMSASAIVAAAQPADVVVLAPTDPTPKGAQRIHTEYGPKDPIRPGVAAQPAVYVYRIVGSI